ncbi:unnamed protein product [Eruca vesicaria subsp. sativa]|uniref:Uncharacterized protein n=1 Tax=Eruca vesicaria subsp. sativa TaxID=29727 RepID=A0ABC8J1J4_ERUVS|nr:unnamed protein product [Eruca vesicaria subsp. sativa]
MSIPHHQMEKISYKSTDVKDKSLAHHVFDQLFLRRHKLHQKKKQIVAPKSWMFKYKPMSQVRVIPQDGCYTCRVRESNKSNHSFVGVNVGLVEYLCPHDGWRSRHNIQSLTHWDDTILGKNSQLKDNGRKKFLRTWKYKHKKNERFRAFADGFQKSYVGQDQVVNAVAMRSREGLGRPQMVLSLKECSKKKQMMCQKDWKFNTKSV